MAPATSNTGEDPRERLYAQYVTTHTHTDPDCTAGPLRLTPSIARLLPLDRTSMILEIGCGAGEMVQELRQAGYQYVHGIDLSAEQVRIATDRGIQGIEQADLRDHLAGRPASYDAILALDVLEHFEKPEVLPLLDLIACALKPGACLIARTPNATSPFAGRYRYGDFTHGLAYTPSSLRQILTVTGFRDFSFSPVNPRATGAWSAARVVIWHAIAAFLKLALIAETGEAKSHIVTQNLLVCATRGDGP